MKAEKYTLEEINKKMGKTILLVTHDPIIASSCDRIIFLKDGKVKMTEASCPDHVCIRQGTIDAPGETVVCLPNKVVLEIVSKDGEEDGLDAVVK